MVGVTNHTTAEARPTSDSASVRLGGQQTTDVRLPAGGEVEELRRWRAVKKYRQRDAAPPVWFSLSTYRKERKERKERCVM